MSISSSEADDASTSPAPDEPQRINPWVVRFFLILAFGLAFGIEGMTLIRSYFFTGEQKTEQVQNGGEKTAPLRVGDELLPATTVSERVGEMRIRARSGGPWTFRLTVTVVNDGESDYRLSLRELEANDGTVFDEVYDVECPPGDSAQLVATWPIGVNARPAALTAEAELQSADSIRTVRRRVSFGHIPVQMER